jgi:hypothetical protein
MSTDGKMPSMSSSGPTETLLSVPRLAVIDETMSKSALRVLALMDDPLMENLDPYWDTEHYAAALAVSNKTVMRAFEELKTKGWIGDVETHRVQRAE